jgi:hypothetical protein
MPTKPITNLTLLHSPNEDLCDLALKLLSKRKKLTIDKIAENKENFNEEENRHFEQINREEIELYKKANKHFNNIKSGVVEEIDGFNFRDFSLRFRCWFKTHISQEDDFTDQNICKISRQLISRQQSRQQR